MSISVKLDDAPILHLLIELLKDGKARVIDELAPLEPIDVDLIIRTLCHKTGINHGSNFEPWYRWFVEDYAYASDDDRETLKLFKEMIENERKFVERITRKRGQPE